MKLRIPALVQIKRTAFCIKILDFCQLSSLFTLKHGFALKTHNDPVEKRPGRSLFADGSIRAGLGEM